MEFRKLGLYIHIPFCIRKCLYCDFLSAPCEAFEREEYRKALCRQLAICGQKMKKAGEEGSFAYLTDSVFFGGGTPSLLTPGQVQAILEAVKENFYLTPDAEITMECNPKTADFSKLEAFRSLGVNRLSIGIQSASDEELKTLGRIHTFADAERCFQGARKAGFANIGADLISAIPGQTPASLGETLKKVLRLNPDHLSVYSLIIEEGTPFYERYADKTGLPSEEETLVMDRLVWRVLEQTGYRRYEISNYAKEGFESRHNLKYWSGEEYLGTGIGAASLMRADCGLFHEKGQGMVRFCWPSDRREFAGYFSEEDADPEGFLAEKDRQTPADEMEEYMFLGLRKTEGISVSEFEQRFHRSFGSVYGEIADRYIGMGLMKWEYDRIALTEDGLEVSNPILADFLLDEEKRLKLK